MRVFKKCGISVSVDGSEDDQINIKGVEGYEVDDSDPLLALRILVITLPVKVMHHVILIAIVMTNLLFSLQRVSHPMMKRYFRSRLNYLTPSLMRIYFILLCGWITL